MKHLFIGIFATSFFATLWLAGSYPQGLGYLDMGFEYIKYSLSHIQDNFAAVVLRKPVTVAELKSKYDAPAHEQRKIRVLIIPGHEPGYGGTEYGKLKEREINVELAQYLAAFLKDNDHYDVMVARDNERWHPVLQNYFETNWNDIIAFFREYKDNPTQSVITSTSTPLVTKPKVMHNSARTDVAIRLYGINKWGNENSIDIALHIHVNDYPRRDTKSPGYYSGFAVYVPQDNYANSPTTKVMAESVFKRLAKYNAVSNLPIEDEGIVEDPDLIAIGAHNTADAASMLIEYGYIYEPQFQDQVTRSKNLRDMAFQTYLGLQDFFGSGNDVSFAYDTLMLPHTWESTFTQHKGTPEDVLALQTALLVDGFYPGKGKSKNDCPRSGRIGSCTLGALEQFQKQYGITGESGYVGEKTRLLLNDKFSAKLI